MATEQLALSATGVDAPAMPRLEWPAAPAVEPRVAEASETISQALDDAGRRRAAYLAAKRALDIAVAATLLLLLAPLFVVIAVAIWLDSGRPILYRGERVGCFARRFRVVKFRSMRPNADASAHAAFLRSLMREETRCAMYKVPDDRRVTRVGAFLRHASLDELPQLWNVLRGEMSLVGPRPDVPYALSDYADWMRRRLVVKPGITGLWQVSGRSRLSLIDMYKLDVDYARTASLLVDLRILLRTLPVVLTRDGAA